MEFPPQLGHLHHLHVLQHCQEGKCQDGDVERGDGATAEEKKRKGEKKQNDDFLFCHGAVEAVISESVETVLWLEDDVVLMDNFFSTLYSLLNLRRSRLQSAAWLDIKLYALPRLRGCTKVHQYCHCIHVANIRCLLLGYAWDLAPLTELLATSLLMTMLLHLVFTKLQLKQGYTLVTFLLVLTTLLSISRYKKIEGIMLNVSSNLSNVQAACGPVAEAAPPAVLLETSTWVWSGGHPLPPTPSSTAAESRCSRKNEEGRQWSYQN